MVGEGKRPYAVDKLYQNNLEQNVNGRKKIHGVNYTVTTTPKRLKDGFTNKLDKNKKKSTPAPSALHATRSSTAAANAVSLLSTAKSVYDGNTPFTSAKKKGRKKKANQTESPLTPIPPSIIRITQ